MKSGQADRRKVRHDNDREGSLCSASWRFESPDDDAAALFDQLTGQVLPGIRDHDPGTLLYLTHTVEDAPLSRVFYEVYRNHDAHAAHEARPEVAAFLQR